MLAVYAENQDPHDYGFDYTDKQLSIIAKKMRYGENKMFGALRYEPIQKEMRKNCKKQELPKQIQWFYDADINCLGQAPLWRKAVRKMKCGMKKIWRKIK